MKSFIIAIQFLTRIPLNKNMDVSEDEFGTSQKFFVPVGIISGLILSGGYYFLNRQLPPMVLGIALLLLEVSTSGGLLLDGFMDTCDGIFSARPREQALEIMKDSRVGAHSVTAVTILFVLKFAIYSSIQYILNPYIILLLAPVVGRWFMLYVITYFPYARKEGIGRIFKDRINPVYFYVGTLILLVLMYFISGELYVFLGLLVTFLFALSIAIRINKFLGGHTGDTYGAMSETAQAIFMFIMTFLCY